jgi:hypothetical protein
VRHFSILSGMRRKREKVPIVAQKCNDLILRAQGGDPNIADATGPVSASTAGGEVVTIETTAGNIPVKRSGATSQAK